LKIEHAVVSFYRTRPSLFGISGQVQKANRNEGYGKRDQRLVSQQRIRHATNPV
jgi:hypothetical protein